MIVTRPHGGGSAACWTETITASSAGARHLPAGAAGGTRDELRRLQDVAGRAGGRRRAGKGCVRPGHRRPRREERLPDAARAGSQLPRLRPARPTPAASSFTVVVALTGRSVTPPRGGQETKTAGHLRRGWSEVRRHGVRTVMLTLRREQAPGAARPHRHPLRHAVSICRCGC